MTPLQRRVHCTSVPKSYFRDVEFAICNLSDTVFAVDYSWGGGGGGGGGGGSRDICIKRLSYLFTVFKYLK